MSLTVIVCTFNNESTILKTLESIKNQNYQPLELIISDDYSNDNTNNLVENWIKKNKHYFRKIKHLKNLKNYGTCRNFSKALNKVKTKYVKPIGADDLLIKESLAYSIKILQTTNSDVFISNLITINEKDNFIKNYSNNFYLSLIILLRLPRSLLLYISLKQNIFPHATILAKREIFKKCLDLRFDLVEDHPLWINIILNKYKIIFSLKPSIKYRMHENQLTKSYGKEIIERTKSDRKKFELYYLEYLTKKAKHLKTFKYKVFDHALIKLFFRNRQYKGEFIQNKSFIFLFIRILTTFTSPSFALFFDKSSSIRSKNKNFRNINLIPKKNRT